MWLRKPLDLVHWLGRWRWNTSMLRSTASAADAGPAFRLAPAVRPGWYMLELQIDLPKVRAACQIVPPRRGHATLPFMVSSGRLCKRLIRIDESGTLQLHFDVPKIGFCLVHFALVRVTESFAVSRMHKRLSTSHPAYRVAFNRAGHAFPVTELWRYYCAVFDQDGDVGGYAKWVREYDTLDDDDRGMIRRAIEQFERTPLISIVMPVYNPDIQWLEGALDSIRSQLYEHWELCIANDASVDPRVRDLIDRYCTNDRRIRAIHRDVNGHISTASNNALALATGEWVALVDQDDLLAEHALFRVAREISNFPGVRLIYSDEDKVDEHGQRFDPYFKSDWNPDLFYSHNMFCHLGVYERGLLDEIGGFRVGFEGAQDYDLALRSVERVSSAQIRHVPHVLYHWRAHAASTASAAEVKSYALAAGRRALEEHFARCGVAAQIESDGTAYRVRYPLPDVPPLVSLVIPTRNALHLLRRCVDSIFEKTTYPNYEIVIVDNGSDDPDTLTYLREILTESRVTVLRDDGSFNYSRLNNFAVRYVNGSIIGLVNNDIEIISPDWLGEMVSHAVRPEVGCVGARLWYSDDTLQHAGVVLGVHGIAGHVHRFYPRPHPGTRGRASLIQAFSAVTAACMVVRRDVYESVGGLNETDLAVTCNDVDFCLRVREAGYRNIWTPYAELYHHESATRGLDESPEKRERASREIAYMQRVWGKLLTRDPAYNPNLTLESEDFGYAWPPRVALLDTSPVDKSAVPT